MAKVPAFYRKTVPLDTTKEIPLDHDEDRLPVAYVEVFHDSDACPDGKQIPKALRGDGQGTTLTRCPVCIELDAAV